MSAIRTITLVLLPGMHGSGDLFAPLLRVPLLAMVADHDRIVARRSSELMQRVRPDMEIVHFNAPHLILQRAADDAARHLSRFVEAVREKADNPALEHQDEEH